MLQLELKNFRRFSDLDGASFSAGLTVIAGVNGAGKSTLVESISYALFGPKRGSGGAGIRSDNSVGPIEVTCRFEVDGHRVHVCRSGELAELWLDGTLQIRAQPGSADQVNRQLRRLLGGLSRDQFEHIYVAEQGQTAGLVAAKPSERRELLAVALQLDVLQEAERLQESERNRSLGTVQALAEDLARCLSLDGEQQAPLAALRAARSAKARRTHVQRFITHVSAGMDRLNDAVTEATQLEILAGEEVERRRDGYEQCKTAFDCAHAELQVQSELSKAFQGFAGPIAAQQALRDEAIRSAAAKRLEIGQARSCSFAARRYRQVEAARDKTTERLSRLPLVKDRWTALEECHHRVRTMCRELAELGETGHEVAKAVQIEATAKSNWEKLQADPTAQSQIALERRKGDLNAQVRQAQQALNSLQQAATDARCPTCDQELGQHARDVRLTHLRSWFKTTLPMLREGFTRAEKDLESRRRVWAQEKRDAQVEWEDATKRVEAARRLEHSSAELSRQLRREQETLRKALKAWRELREATRWRPGEAAELQLDAERLNRRANCLRADAQRFASIERLMTEVSAEDVKAAAAAKELDRLRDQRGAVGYDVDVHETAKQAEIGARKVLDETHESLIEARNAASKRERESTERRRIVDDAADRRRRYDASLKCYYEAERLTTVLTDFCRHYFAANTSEIARQASLMLAQSVTDGSILGVEFQANGDLIYRDASHVRQPVSRLSGGEKALVGLCLRIAVAEHALRIARSGRLRFLVLDEVLSALDDERRETMQRVFDEVQRRGVFEQVLMITHLEEVKHGWRGARLTVEKIDAKTSRIVQEGSGTQGTEAGDQTEEIEAIHA